MHVLIRIFLYIIFRLVLGLVPCLAVCFPVLALFGFGGFSCQTFYLYWFFFISQVSFSGFSFFCCILFPLVPSPGVFTCTHTLFWAEFTSVSELVIFLGLSFLKAASDYICCSSSFGLLFFWFRFAAKIFCCFLVSSFPLLFSCQLFSFSHVWHSAPSGFWFAVGSRRLFRLC